MPELLDDPSIEAYYTRMQTFGHGRATLIAGDMLTFGASLFLTLFLRYQEIPSREVIDMHLAPFLFLFLLWAVVFLVAGLYDPYVLVARRKVANLVFSVQALNILLAAVFFFLLPFGIEPKTNLIIYLGISTALVCLWRLYLFPRIALEHSMTALLIGNSSEAQAIAAVFASNPYFNGVDMHMLQGDILSDADALRLALLDFTERHDVNMIIADMSDPQILQLTRDFYSLVFEEKNIRFYSLPVLYEELHHRVSPSLVKEAWILENITTSAPHYAYDFLKRCVDIVGAVLLLIPSLVLFPFIMAAIKLDDGGSIFYKTQRIGQHNKPMMLLKFRTKNGADSGDSALHSTLVDTKVGVFLRKTRLDELPQLFNVLRGDLSFIGPRPEMPALASVYAQEIPYYNLRHLIKPGLSGWAQINDYDAPRAGVDIQRTINKLSYDLYYLKRRSFLLDIEIALKTIKTFLLRTGT